MIRFRLAAAVLAVGTSGLLLSACGGAATVTKTQEQPAASGPVAAKDDTAAAKLPERFKGGIIVASGVYPPMSWLNDQGQFTGFDYDLGQALGAKLGVPFTFEEQAFDSIIPSLQSGKHHIIINGMNDTVERQKVLDFVDYFHGGMAILVKKGNPDSITTVLDLCGKTVAVAKATVQADLMKTESENCTKAGKSPITISQLPTENDAMVAVRAGKAVADVLDAAPAEYNAATAGGGAQFEVVHDPANPTGYAPVYTGIGVLKKDHDLTLALQAALESLLADGTYTKLLAKYSLGSYAVDNVQLNGGS
jgi:polar amino acid transport system substrate-binding protein